MTGSVLVASRARSRRQIFEAGDTRQHPVENDEIGHRLGETQFRLVAAFLAFDDEAFGFEIIGEQQRQRGLVLDDQDARRGRSRARGLVPQFDHLAASAEVALLRDHLCAPAG